MGTINHFPYTVNSSSILLEFQDYSADKPPIYEPSLRTLLSKRYEPKMASNQKYLFVGAGIDYNTDSDTNTMECIDKDFVHISAPTLTQTDSSKPYCTGSTKKYAVFSGAKIELYDHDLVKVISNSAPISATSIHEFAGNILFMGVHEWHSNELYIPQHIVAMSLELLTVRYAFMGISVMNAGCTQAGNHFVSAGGRIKERPDFSRDAVAIDEYLTHSFLTPISDYRCNISSCTLDGCALFACGESYGAPTNIVDTYDSNLMHDTLESLPTHRTDMACGVVSEHALFVGGNSLLVDSYDNLFTRTSMPPMQYNSDSAWACFKGRLFLMLKFAQADSRIVSFKPGDFSVKLYPGCAYSFDCAPESTVSEFQSIPINAPANGYIKYSAAKLT